MQLGLTPRWSQAEVAVDAPTRWATATATSRPQVIYGVGDLVIADPDPQTTAGDR